MDEPTPIGEIIDEAMQGILGPAGNEFYAELVRQTQATRTAIEREVRGKFREYEAQAFAEMTGLQTHPESLALAARMEANRRIQEELGRRISAEELAFRERVNALFGWVEGRQQPKGSGSQE
jgi:hypothetical protein